MLQIDLSLKITDEDNEEGVQVGEDKEERGEEEGDNKDDIDEEEEEASPQQAIQENLKTDEVHEKNP